MSSPPDADRRTVESAPPPPGAALLAALRRGTAAAHARLDESPLAAQIADRSLDAEGYRRLIDWQLGAHLTAEPGLAALAWPADYTYVARAHVLVAEAAALRLSTPRVSPLEPPGTLAVAVGRAYVLEGASLGGNVIVGRLERTPALVGLAPFAFYRYQRDHGLGQWRRFVSFTQARRWGSEEIEIAVAEAERVFGVFGS